MCTVGSTNLMGTCYSLAKTGGDNCQTETFKTGAAVGYKPAVIDFSSQRFTNNKTVKQIYDMFSHVYPCLMDVTMMLSK
jgi:hypothetical protein